MTKDEIIRMAREAGLVSPMTFYAAYECFANLVAAHKAEIALAEAYRGGYKAGMEAAAVVCDNVAGMYQHAHNASSENIADECATAIRARGTT
jgi:membrane protease subunit (stomatin/prohibitin family)